MSNFINSLVHTYDSSVFRQNNDVGMVDFQDFPCSLSVWLNRELSNKFDKGLVTLEEVAKALPDSIPVWQRDNNQWSNEMQISFLTNYFKGFSISPLTLYYFNSKRKSKVLDGLQRITAFYSFFTEEMIFEFNGKKITNTELLANNEFKNFLFRQTVDIQFVRFNNEIEAIDHYIDINENISHSDSDILKAKQYRQKLIDNNL